MGLFGSSKDGATKSGKPPKLAAGYYDPQHPYKYTRKKLVEKDIKAPPTEATELGTELGEAKGKGGDDGDDDEDDEEDKDKDPNQLDETELNTKLNALLYHTSNDSIAMYKNDNTSSDLLGRLYYDDFDSESMASPIPSGANTPLLSPNHTGGALQAPSLSHLGLTPMNSHISSPLSIPSKPSFERGISFDTSDDHRKSLTFKVKHPQFKFRRNNNTFLTGFKNDANSLTAVEWLFDEMVIHGDSIVVLQVLDEKTHSKIDKAEAHKALDKLKALNLHSKKISLVFEIVIGNTEKLLKAAIAEYKPAMMIMGTHRTETGTHKSLLSKTSFAKNFLECALVPVILVKPNYHYVEFLDVPITSETYFEDLLKHIDLSDSYLKKGYKSKSSKSPPMSSRNLLSPSQSALSPSQSRNVLSPSLLSPNLSPSTSRTEHNLLVPDRGRGQDHTNSSFRDKSQERSSSRSRSATRFARFFK